MIFVVDPLLRISGLTIEFPIQGRFLPAVRDFSLQLGRGKTLGLVGESGSGKSVTALGMMRLLPPQARVRGSVQFDGRELLPISDEAMRAIRGARMAMIFQEPMTALNPVMRVGDQVAEAALAHDGTPGARRREPGAVSKEDAWRRAVAVLQDVQIADAGQRARDYPHQLSGGQRQRVMIAMALVNRPELLIADEPTTALDVTVQAQILELLAELRQKFGLALLLISHDLAVVSQVADEVAVMYAGSLVESGPAEAVFRAPAHPYTRGLLRAVPDLKTDRTRPLNTIEGTVPALTALPPGCPFEPRCDLRVSQCTEALPPLAEVAPGHFARCAVTKAGSRQ
jgi:oligopeptide/dipeptide ABC transporter ATP-binding protein